MECMQCGDRLNADGVCENCGWSLADEQQQQQQAAPSPVAKVEDDGEISSTVTKIKICPSCKTECAEDSKFCHGCGYSFTGARASSTGTDFSTATNTFGGSAGQSIGKQPTPPETNYQSTRSQTGTSSQRRCAHCGKFVDKMAVKCNFCGKMVFGTGGSTTSTTSSSYSSTSSSYSSSSSSYGSMPAYNATPSYSSSSSSSYGSSYSSSSSYSSRPKRKNGYAKAALLFGLFGFFYFAWIPGLALSKKAAEFARDNGGAGRGMTAAARVFSTIWAIIYGLAFFVMCAEGL